MATEFRLSYTGAQINAKLGKIDSLAEKSELPTNISDLTNDSGFITQSDMRAYAQPIGDYALKNEMPEAAVASVNGKVGAVTLTASDIGAVSMEDVEAYINDAILGGAW